MPLTFHRARISTDPKQVLDNIVAAGHPPELVAAVIQEHLTAEIFLSDCGTYQVMRRPAKNGFGRSMIALSVKRVDREPIHDWRHMQEIKNALIGPECEAFEIFPAESRLVDSANQYWIWGFEDPAIRLPIGFRERLVTDAPVAGTKQRPFAKASS